MVFSTPVLSSPHNQTDPVRSIALPNPKRHSEKILFEKSGSIFSTCTADLSCPFVSVPLRRVLTLSSTCPGKFRKSCGWHRQAFGIMSQKDCAGFCLLLFLLLFLPSLSLHGSTNIAISSSSADLFVYILSAN